MLIVTGYRSAITQALLPMLPPNETAERGEALDRPTDAERYFFCAGMLRSQSTMAQTETEMAETFNVNCGHVIRACDRIFAVNDDARICVMGSESGFAWSFDGVYAAAKAALHRYVETKKLRTHNQQLVCIAPSIIEDAGMTLRRNDQDRLEARRNAHPKGRFLLAQEVARLVHHVLYVDHGYLSGIVIRMNGGEHCRG